MSGATTPKLAEIEEVLSRVPLFSRLNKRELRKLARLCVPSTFPEGQMVIEEGSVGLGLFLVTSGSIEIFKGKNGKKLNLGTAEAGDILGEIALVDDQPRTASAIAMTPTECLVLTRDAFDTLVKKDPEIAWCIVPSLAERVRELHEKAVRAEGKAAAALGESRPAREVPVDQGDRDEDDEGHEEESSDLVSMMAKSFRMQYGVMAGAARGVTRSARVFERFLDELADETELKDNDSWTEVLGNMPTGMISATRVALDECETMPQAMVDAFRRYSEEK